LDFPRVFLFYGDLINCCWRPGIAELNLVAGRPDMPGATYRQLLIGPFGRRINADYQLTKVKRNEELEFKVTSGPIRPEGAFYFEVSGAGTNVRFVLDYNPTWLSAFKLPVAAWVLHKEVRNLDKLREVLERYYRPPAPIIRP